MNPRNNIRPVAAVILAISISSHLTHAADGWLGELAPLALTNAINESGKQISAVRPDTGTLADADKQLLGAMAIHGIRQLELSRSAATLSPSDDIRMIAKGEITGQTLVADKLREIAIAGGTTIPTGPDDDTRQLVEDLRSESGTGLDRMYLKKCGITGHELLLATMEKTRAQAKSPALRELAVATLPLIHTQLRMARIELADMK